MLPICRFIPRSSAKYAAGGAKRGPPHAVLDRNLLRAVRAASLASGRALTIPAKDADTVTDAVEIDALLAQALL